MVVHLVLKAVLPDLKGQCRWTPPPVGTVQPSLSEGSARAGQAEPECNLLSQVQFPLPGSIWHPHPELWSLRVWPLMWAFAPIMECAKNLCGDESLSTRRLYALKWSVFSDWCAVWNHDPITCDLASILSFLV